MLLIVAESLDFSIAGLFMNGHIILLGGLGLRIDILTVDAAENRTVFVTFR